MAKIDISIALNLVMGAFKAPLKGKSGVVREFVCIPVDELSVDKNGKVWLNLVGYDDTKYDKQTHSLKQKISKAQYDALPVDENGRKALLPYLGQVKQAEGAPVAQQSAPSQGSSFKAATADDGDLPF